MFRLLRVHLQPVGDLLVMALACQGVHGWVLGLFLLQLALVGRSVAGRCLAAWLCFVRREGTGFGLPAIWSWVLPSW